MGKMIKADYYATIGDSQFLAFKKDNNYKLMIVPRRGYVTAFIVDRECLEGIKDFMIDLLEELEKEKGENND